MYKMLVVDDESLTRDYLKLTIPQINPGWEVAHVASDGKEALEILDQHAVDLILTDIKMPVMDGLTLCKIVSKMSPRPRTVILSGHDEFTFAKEAITYGVNEYLLKPIVKEELRVVLERITHDLDKEKSQLLTQQSMQILSEDSKNHVVKNFLKAVIVDSNAEIKVLYPLLFRLKVSLIETEGNLMILSLDEDMILRKSIPYADIPVFKYILQQITTEIVEEGRVFYDTEENTIVLVTGDCQDDLIKQCRAIHAKVADAIYRSTGITISGAIGNCVNDVLRLNSSYRKARKMLMSRLLSGGNSCFAFSDESKDMPSILELDKTMMAIQSGLLDRNETNYMVSVRNYAELMGGYQLPVVYRYGVHLIRSIAAMNPNFTDEGIQAAQTILRKLESPTLQAPSKEEVLLNFYEILKSFILHATPKHDNENEHDLVARAKEYIYSHYSEPISLAIIADTIGVSASYLSNIFHKSVNESYIKFLTRVRMEQAAKLLRARPSEKIIDVSDKVGYVSVKHFSHVFKQHFYMPPGEYQEKQAAALKG
ncbi:Regulator of RpoS [Paenibacillus allorhizoplanae]|uniref:Regulator of RpoS n=1 Tax=Paenibacillus allorhizoplanae TaxID=2905648 RepID=A0ABM9CKE6_9BACL|nr:response regulator [Paenibacillus allorhizoplanae]CAH1216791.1 Regulator of RpoS [Paenibacillus allorhizoplanae]